MRNIITGLLLTLMSTVGGGDWINVETELPENALL